MNWTSDMIRLKTAADTIAEKRKEEMKAPRSIVQVIENSYYEKRTEDSNTTEYILQKYNFQTLVELKRLLEVEWRKMGKDEMLDFIPICMAAAGKNKPQDGKSVTEHKISPFIYEF